MIVEKIRNARTSNVIIPIIPVQTPIHIFIIISQNSELSSDTKYILDKLIPVIIIHSITSPLPIIYKRIFPIPQSKIVPFFILSLLFLRTEFRYINLFQKTLHFYHTCFTCICILIFGICIFNCRETFFISEFCNRTP